MKVLLSIKPEFADKIFNGSKKYEFRKSIFRNSDVKTIIVYASSPVQKVIGEFTIDMILEEQKEQLWSMTREFSGISKAFFDDYFAQKDVGYAIKIGTVKRYIEPKRLNDLDIQYAPQSFIYL